MRDGLPQNSVTDIIQASDGYIWLTTYGGVARFDGVTFKVLHSGNTAGLDAARFLAVVQAPDGAIWLAGEHRGVFRYFDNEARSVGAAERVWDLAVDHDGVVWGAVDDGLVRYDTQPPSRIPHASLFHFTPLPGGALLASGRDGHVVCVSGDCGALPEGPKHGGRSWWYAAEDGFLVGTHKGLFRRGVAGWDRLATSRTLAPPPCTAWQGAPWCVLGQRPVLAATLGEKAVFVPLPDTPTIAVMADREGGIWLGLDGGGLMRLQPRQARMHGPNGAVFSVVESPDGAIWFGDTNLSYIAGDLVGALPPSRATLWPDGEGGVLGARTGQVFRVARAGAQVLLEQDGLHYDALAPVSGPWFVVDGALYRASSTDNPPTFVATVAALGGTRLRILRPGDGPGVWGIVDEDVLVEIVDGTVTRWIELGYAATVRDILARGSRVWVATYGDGLLAVEGEEVVASLTPKDGMCDYAISHIFDTRDGNLWFNTNRGLGWVSEASLNAAVQDSGAVICPVVNSGEADGAAGVRTADGRLWVPTTMGLAEVNPATVEAAAPPRPVLQEVSYEGHDLVADGAAVVGPGTLRVKYVGLHFRDPHGVTYRYRLWGVDDLWSPVTVSRDVHFRDLAPGRYTFEMQARGVGGGWSPSVTLSFIRAPVWTETLLVRVGVPTLLVVLVGGGLLLGLRDSRLRNRRLQLEIEERTKTEQRLQAQQQENVRVQRALEAARRLEALGRLAGGVAHDFNNLLSIPMAAACMLEDHPDLAVRQEIAALYEFVERSKELTRPLLLYGRGSPGVAEPVLLGHAAQALFPMLRRLIRADIELEVNVVANCAARIDRGRIDQIITNLVLNSRDAISGPGWIRVAVSRRGEDSVISVSDDGRGFEPGLAKRIFEPYFTTKELGYGTGLGLAMVQGAVLEAGGHLDVQSEIGKGTTVTVCLPHATVSEIVRPRASQALAVTGLRVLVVDDQPAVLRSVATIAARLGWRIQTAGSLHEAEAAARSHPIDVLLTDVVMPGGGGLQVHDAVSFVRPGVATLYMSGYTDGEALEGRQVLCKPFSGDELAEAVQKVLADVERDRSEA